MSAYPDIGLQLNGFNRVWVEASFGMLAAIRFTIGGGKVLPFIYLGSFEIDRLYDSGVLQVNRSVDRAKRLTFK